MEYCSLVAHTYCTYSHRNKYAVAYFSADFCKHTPEKPWTVLVVIMVYKILVNLNVFSDIRKIVVIRE